ncbi:tannase/feruloyl esterase family alpha/beta hydrolase, partial [Halomonas marinisediminis]
AEDGVIADPRACEVDLSGLQCTGAAGDDCLTEAELDVLAKWRQGPVNAAGEQLYPGGIPEGSEPFWWLWLTG